MNELLNVTPIDGRYRQKTKELSAFFSEYALIRFRLLVEIEYLIALSNENGIEQVESFDQSQVNQLRKIYQNFSIEKAKQIKEIEQKTNHDVKSIEYFC